MQELTAEEEQHIDGRRNSLDACSTGSGTSVILVPQSPQTQVECFQFCHSSYSSIYTILVQGWERPAFILMTTDIAASR